MKFASCCQETAANRSHRKTNVLPASLREFMFGIGLRLSFKNDGSTGFSLKGYLEGPFTQVRRILQRYIFGEKDDTAYLMEEAS